MASESKTSGKTRDTLRTVRQDLNTIVSRLEAADVTTQKSVKALETALRALANEGDKDTQNSQAKHDQLEEQIKALKARLTKMVRDTQIAVNADLKNVLADPRLATLAQAIDTANARLHNTEAAQEKTLSDIKKYIADLARTVDQNLDAERKAREDALAATQEKQENLQTDITACLEKIGMQSQTLNETTTRMTSIENDTAAALQHMGDKVAQFAQQAADARQAQDHIVKGKISDIALETQKNFELYKDDVDRNIEALQSSHATAKRDFNQDIDDLRTRLETLEYGLSPAQAPLQNLTAAAPTAAPLQDAFTPIEPDSMPAAIEAYPENTAQPLDIVGAETPPTPYIPQENAANPYTSASPYAADTLLEPANAYAGPQDQAYYPDTEYPEPAYPASTHTDPAAHTKFDPDPYSQLVEQSASPYGPLGTDHTGQEPYLSTGQDAYPQTYGDMPYSNPAYAENGVTMDQDRPGGPIDAVGGAKRSALFTPSNLRAAILGVAVLGVGYVAVSKFTGNAPTPTSPASDVFVESQSSDLVADNSAQTLPNIAPVQTLEPIGNYAKDVTQTIDQAIKTPNALEAAVTNGDPSAEYQLGLVKLQNGETDEALKLLRASANKGQAAAQYRLAKLYETGKGVTQDLQTARSLIEKSARNGNRIAMHDLANFYANGIGGVTQDLSLAAKWFEKAAERGVVDSQYNIGYLYEFGFGVTKNPVEAYVWYGIASNQGDKEADRRIAALNETLSSVEIQSAKDRINGFQTVQIDKNANGIFENQPWQTASHKANDKPLVAEVQTLLNELGYSVGTADGQVGARTRTAIIAFEKANGLPETGRINTALVDQLELAAGV